MRDVHFTIMASHCAPGTIDARPGITLYAKSNEKTKEVYPHDWQMSYMVNLTCPDDPEEDMPAPAYEHPEAYSDSSNEEEDEDEGEEEGGEEEEEGGEGPVGSFDWDGEGEDEWEEKAETESESDVEAKEEDEMEEGQDEVPGEQEDNGDDDEEESGPDPLSMEEVCMSICRTPHAAAVSCSCISQSMIEGAFFCFCAALHCWQTNRLFRSIFVVWDVLLSISRMCMSTLPTAAKCS
jgi:hypothetical protein